MANFLRFVIMGPPGSGKGTISSRIVQNFNLAYLASGDILRSHIRQETSMGKEAKAFIEKGQLVPDELITNLILDQLQTFSKSNWLLDESQSSTVEDRSVHSTPGFPRTVKQATDLSSKFNITMALNLAVPDEIIIDRLKGRWLHPASGRIYNTDFNPPKVPGKDDITGEDLVQREDDKPEIVLARLLNYKKGNAPILDFFREKNLLQEFAGKESNEIWPKIKIHLEEIFRQQK